MSLAPRVARAIPKRSVMREPTRRADPVARRRRRDQEGSADPARARPGAVMERPGPGRHQDPVATMRDADRASVARRAVARRARERRADPGAGQAPAHPVAGLRGARPRPVARPLAAMNADRPPAVMPAA